MSAEFRSLGSFLGFTQRCMLEGKGDNVLDSPEYSWLSLAMSETFGDDYSDPSKIFSRAPPVVHQHLFMKRWETKAFLVAGLVILCRRISKTDRTWCTVMKSILEQVSEFNRSSLSVSQLLAARDFLPITCGHGPRLFSRRPLASKDQLLAILICIPSLGNLPSVDAVEQYSSFKENTILWRSQCLGSAADLRLMPAM